MRGVVLAMLATACYRPASEAACTATCVSSADCVGGLVCSGGLCAEPGNACGGDAGTERPIDTSPPPCAGNLLGHDLFFVCLNQAPSAGRSLAVNFDTTSSSLCDSASVDHPETDVCYVIGTSIDITAKISASGPKRLALVATGNITIPANLVLDVSSTVGFTHGAGANPTLCGDTSGANGTTEGGAAGGSNHGTGGRGGAAQANGAAGTPTPPFTTPGFHGGCHGGTNTGILNNGDGGGAVYLIAGGMISVSGAIDASGGGGGGGMVDNGGNGGGAGGFLGLDANAITFGNAAILIAAGGGGGGGGGPGAGDFGQNGGQPFSAPGEIGHGGAGGTNATVAGGKGGDGSPPDSLVGADGFTGDPACGSGAGGGGAGFIRIFSATPLTSVPALIDPPAS